MQYKEILNGLDYQLVNKVAKEMEIANLQFDSRKVNADSMFFAIRGTQTDGHKFIDKVIEKGVKIIVCEELPESTPEHISFVLLKDTSYALGIAAHNFFGQPSSKIKLVGITGTNGKTTSVTLLYDLFRGLGYSVGLLSTVHNLIDEREISATHTTGDAIQINDLLNRMVESGCSHCFMEVSSHAIVQNRIAGLDFDGGIFSNITHDHLDYHKTFDEYIKAKKLFFDRLPKSAFALTNIDDKNGRVMLQNTQAEKYTYGLKNLSQFNARIVDNTFDGLMMNIAGKEVYFRMVGEFNAYNLLSAYAAAFLLKEDKDEILSCLSTLKGAEGRFDYFKSESGIYAIVDYAHTPDALKNVLKTINTIRSRNEQLITVFGCGGDRDSTKRPEMGKIAANHSDRIIITSDNPRTEDPEAIIEDIKKGIEVHQRNKVLSISNRREAIKTAVALAQPNDILLLAGKGHEKYQEINGERKHFDDKEELSKVLNIN